MPRAAPKRFLLKFSGEVLAGPAGFGLDLTTVARLCREVCEAHAAGARFAIVPGGGNLFRGGALARAGLDRITGDQMGMLATCMNALALRDGLRNAGLDALACASVAIAGVLPGYARDEALDALARGTVLVLAGGTGNPLFTTDTTACLRGVELGVQAVIKATKVDGVYSADPVQHPAAERFSELSYAEVMERELAVMDTTAIVLARDNGLPIIVCDMNESGALTRITQGEKVGTLISGQTTR